MRVLDDFKRIFKVHKGVEAVSRGVFYLELVPDAVCYVLVFSHLILQGVYSLDDLGVLTLKVGSTLVISGIQHGAVVKNDPDVCDGFVAVFRNPAAHAAGVVCNNSTHHGRINGGRIRADFLAELGKIDVCPAADHPGFKADFRRLVKDAIPFPAFTEAHQDRIGYRLAGQTGSGSPEGHGQPVPGRSLQDQHHFLLVFHIDDNFGY